MNKNIPIDPIKDSITRFETNQTVNTFLVNMLKDYLRADYEFYADAPNKQTFALHLLETAVRSLRIAGGSAVNEKAIWDTSTETVFGKTKVLSRFGHYLQAVIENYRRMELDELNSIVDAARQKVG